MKEHLKQLAFLIFLAWVILGPKYGVLATLILIAIFLILLAKSQHKPDDKIIEGVESEDGRFTTAGKKPFNFHTIFMSTKFPGLTRSFSLIIGALFLVLLAFTTIVIIGAGEVGVYSLFGKVRDAELQSGIHLKNPFARVTSMSIRTEEYTMSKVANEGRVQGDDAIPALTREGLSVTLDITVLFHLESDKASELYRDVGLNFEEKVIRPEIRSIIREVIAFYDAKDIYSEKRDEVVKRIQDKLTVKLETRGIKVEDVLLRDVTLPANLAQAIQEKLAADQEQQKYDFILQKEKKEAERKRIEAAGQRDSQKIINESLTTNYLYYQYINQLKDRQGTIYVPTNPSTGMPQFKELGQ